MNSPLGEGLFMIHKIITRGVATSLRRCDEYLEKPGIPPAHASGFSLYVSTLILVMHSHHLSEDEIAFPFFQNFIEGPYDRLKDDHHLISAVLKKLENCLSGINEGKISDLRNALIELENLWTPHFKMEEDNFSSEKINAVISLQEQQSVIEKLSKHGRQNSGPAPLVLPFVIYSLEGAEREELTGPLPWIIRKVLVPVIWKKKWEAMKPFLSS